MTPHKCEVCGCRFEMNDEEALATMADRFGPIPPEERVAVCPLCWTFLVSSNRPVPVDTKQK